LLKDKVKQDLNNNDSSLTGNSATLQVGKGTFEIVKKELKVNEETGEIHNIDLSE
jgi:hypothetical protein